MHKWFLIEERWDDVKESGKMKINFRAIKGFYRTKMGRLKKTGDGSVSEQVLNAKCKIMRCSVMGVV